MSPRQPSRRPTYERKRDPGSVPDNVCVSCLAVIRDIESAVASQSIYHVRCRRCGRNAHAKSERIAWMGPYCSVEAVCRWCWTWEDVLTGSYVKQEEVVHEEAPAPEAAAGAAGDRESNERECVCGAEVGSESAACRCRVAGVL